MEVTIYCYRLRMQHKFRHEGATEDCNSLSNPAKEKGAVKDIKPYSELDTLVKQEGTTHILTHEPNTTSLEVQRAPSTNFPRLSP